MKIIGTQSSSPLSKLIRWALTKKGLPKPRCSHVAIVFDNHLVLHSNLLGVHLQWYPHFLKTQLIIEEISYSLTLEAEEAIYLSLIEKDEGLQYNFLGFAYQAYRILLWKYFNRAMPLKNKWAGKGALLCYELLERLPQWVKCCNSDPYTMITPDQMIQILRSAQEKNDA